MIVSGVTGWCKSCYLTKAHWMNYMCHRVYSTDVDRRKATFTFFLVYLFANIHLFWIWWQQHGPEKLWQGRVYHCVTLSFILTTFNKRLGTENTHLYFIDYSKLFHFALVYLIWPTCWVLIYNFQSIKVKINSVLFIQYQITAKSTLRHVTL